MEYRCRIVLAGAIALLVSGAATPAQHAEFHAIGILPTSDPNNFYSQPRAISADGTTVVGGSSGQAFRWTESTGIVSIAPGAAAYGVSADGSVIVGEQIQYAMVWTAATGPTLIAGTYTFSSANSVSGDGGTVVGSAAPERFQHCPASQWIPHPYWLEDSKGFLKSGPGNSLTLLGTASEAGQASMISADASTIVGSSRVPTCNSAEPPWQATVWIGAGTLVLGSPGGYSHAAAVSGDGRVVVGTDANERAFRWSAATGKADMGVLPGYTTSAASAVSANGEIVLGGCKRVIAGWPEVVFFVWDRHRGMRPGTEVLSQLGLPGVPGWTLYSIDGLSADHRVIFGRGINPQGRNEGWVAYLDLPLGCYADCTGDSALTVADFGCFQTTFVAGNPYADCNADGGLTVADFGCFQTKFVAGCP